MEYFLFLLVFAGFLFWFGLRDPQNIHKSLVALGSTALVVICTWMFLIGRDNSSWASVFFAFSSIIAVLIGLLLAIGFKGKHKRFALIFALALPIGLYVSMEIARYTA